MTRTLLLSLSTLATALALPAPAIAEPDQRAVGLCRAELNASFPADAIRQQRVASISGNSRRTRVVFTVTADRRYNFECTIGPDRRVATASFDPPRSAGQLAAGQR